MSSLTLPLILIGGLIAVLAATVLKDISPFGTDNFTAPIVVAMALFWPGL